MLFSSNNFFQNSSLPWQRKLETNQILFKTVILCQDKNFYNFEKKLGSYFATSQSHQLDIRHERLWSYAET